MYQVEHTVVSDGEPKTGYIEHMHSIWAFCDKSFKHSMKIEINFWFKNKFLLPMIN